MCGETGKISKKASQTLTPGEFPAQRPVTRSFDVFFDLRLNKPLSKQPRGWWFETPTWSLWRQCNATTGILLCYNWLVYTGLFPRCFIIVNFIDDTTRNVLVNKNDSLSTILEFLHHSTVTWTLHRLKSQITRLFTQQIVYVNNIQNMKARYSLVLREGNPPETGGFPSKMISNAENDHISWTQIILII